MAATSCRPLYSQIAQSPSKLRTFQFKRNRKWISALYQLIFVSVVEGSFNAWYELKDYSPSAPKVLIVNDNDVVREHVHA
jgi:hypothetical protein